MLLILAVEGGFLVYFFILIMMTALKSNELKVQKRLEALTSNNSETQKDVVSVLNQLNTPNKYSFMKNLLGGKLISKLTSKLELSGTMLKVEEYLLIWGCTAIFPALLAKMFGADFLTIGVLAIAGAIIPPIIIERKKSKRISLFEMQLSEALVVICNCLRGGFSFNQAMESVVNEMPEPISKEFGKTIREMKLGVSMDKALLNMVTRLKNENLELLVATVNIQRQVGGNLSEVLENISTTLKERIRVKGEIKVLTATGRMSGIVIGLLPILMLGILMLLNPTYVKLFFDTTLGMVLLSLGAVMEFIGFILVKKIVNVQF